MQPLFQGELLYCEGRPRPFVRGKLHCLCTATAFYYFKVMPWSPVGTPTAVVIYLAHVASSVYHTVPVKRSTEIVLQKIDFIMANAYIGVVVYPMALLAFPGPGHVFAGTMACIAVWNSVDVWRSKYHIARPVLLVATVVPFSPFIASELTTYELNLFMAIVSCMMCGGSLMILYDLFDVYHSFSVVCFVCIMQMNASVVTRLA